MPSYIQKSKFFGGLNSGPNYGDARSDQLTSIQNMIFDSKSIRKRKGMWTYPATQSITDRVNCLAELNTASQGTWKFGIFEGVGYYESNGAWTALSGATSLDTSAVWDTVDTRIGSDDVLILTNGVDVPKKITMAASTVFNDCEAEDWTNSNSAAETLNSNRKINGSYSLNLGIDAEILDDCTSITGWTATWATDPTIVSAPEQGGDCIAMGSNGSGPTYATARYVQSITSTDGTGDDLYVWIYVEDTTELDATQALRLTIGSSAADYYYKYITRAELSNGWNRLGGTISGFSTSGSPDITDLDILKLHFTRDDDTTPLDHGNIRMKNWIIVGDTSVYTYTAPSNAVDTTGVTSGYMWFYINDTADLDATTAVKIRIGTDSSNYYHKTYASSALNDGWNQLGGAYTSFTEVGTVNLASMDYFVIEITGVVVLGNCGMDFWHAAGSAAPTWANLDTSPPSAKYVVEFNNYIFFLNITDDPNDNEAYPARAYRSDLLDPTTWGLTNWYDFEGDDGFEITGAAVIGGRLVVFKEKGIFEVSYTADTTTPFIKKTVSRTMGAMHRTVQGGDNFIIFADQGGVYSYLPGGRIESLTYNKRNNINVAQTYKTNVIDSTKKDSLHSVYIPDSRQYWLACGSSTPNDTIMVFDGNYGAWTIFDSLIDGFDITYLKLVNDDGNYVPWIGLEQGQSLLYGEHYTTTAARSDQEQDGTQLDVTAGLITDHIDLNNPPILQRFLGGNIKGWQKSANNITLKCHLEGRNAITIGTMNFYDASNARVNKRFRLSNGCQRGYSHRLELTETGGASADTRWRIDGFGYSIQSLGIR